MNNRIEEIKARLDGLSWVGDEFIAHAPADIAWLLEEVEAWRRHCGCCDCQRMRGGEVIGCECPKCKRYRAGERDA